MWYFRSPEIVFGEEALTHLDELEGKRAFIVTDKTMVNLGFAEKVKEHLYNANIESHIFDEVEPEPAVETVKKASLKMKGYSPDWVIGLGGGSAIDAAKAAWVFYEKPELTNIEEMPPFGPLGLRKKARLIAIPTTSGTGSEATWATILTDKAEVRKMGVGNRELLPDIAIVDPEFVMGMPPQLTADTGMDALTHAVEGYTNTIHNDFADGLCLKAIQLVFQYLPRAYKDGSDREAREKMHNAATIAGLGFGNSMCALAHATGHSLGAVFHIPHGRAVGLFLPYTIEFNRDVLANRYLEIAQSIRLKGAKKETAASTLTKAIRRLARTIKQPLTIKALGISKNHFENSLEKLISNAEMDNQLVTSVRVPSTEEFFKFFHYAYEGKTIDF